MCDTHKFDPSDPFAGLEDEVSTDSLCSACGRELTNQESIDLGIGPICREKWF